MNPSEYHYQTITAPAEGTFRDKGSKFIAYAYPISSEQQARERLAALKVEHPKARHHCWAFRLTPDGSVFRINDDGEPSGTAGRPILNTLLSHDLTNIVVIVVRYFGGTLLGVPGLINAYKRATLDALSAAEIVELPVTEHYSILFDYERMNDVMRIVKEETLVVLKQDFDNRCTLEVEIPKGQVERVVGRLEQLAGITLHHLVV